MENDDTYYFFFRPTLCYLDDNRLPSRQLGMKLSSRGGHFFRGWRSENLGVHGLLKENYLSYISVASDPPIASVLSVLEPT